MEFQDANLSEAVRLIGLVHDEAERQVLSQMLSNTGVALEIARGEVETEEGEIQVDEEFFYNETYKMLYRSICDLVEKANSPLDSFTICSRALRLSRERKVKTNVNVQLVDELRNLKSEGTLYGSLVALQDRKYLREMVQAAGWAMQNARPDVDAKELIAQFIEKVHRALPLAQSERALEGNKAVEYHMEVMRKRIEARKNGKIIALDYPWESWRNLLIPQRPGKYVSIIMPHGQGKSTYCGNIAEWRAMNGYETVVFLLEDTKDDFMDRTVARWSGVTLDRLQGGELSEEEDSRYQRAMTKIEGFHHRLHVQECAGMTAGQVIRELKRWKMKHPEIVCAEIDHMGAFAPDRWHSKLKLDGYQAQGEDAQGLVGFSNEYGVALTVFDQLNKAGEKSSRDGDMFATDQYGAGKKSWAAGTIVACNRAYVQNQDEFVDGKCVAKVGQLSTKVTVRVRKQNNGPTGAFTQRMIPSVFRIKEIG